MEKVLRFRWLVVGMYLASALLIIFLLGPVLGREIFPGVRGDQLRLRFRAPTGTRVEVTEQMADEILDEIKSEAGSNNVMMTLGYVGIQPAAYPSTPFFFGPAGRTRGCFSLPLD